MLPTSVAVDAQELKGIINDNLGKPVAGVYIYSAPFDGSFAYSREDGTFRLSLHTPTSDSIIFFKIGFQRIAVSFQTFRQAAPDEIELAPSGISDSLTTRINTLEPRTFLREAIFNTMIKLPKREHQYDFYFLETDYINELIKSRKAVYGTIADKSFASSFSHIQVSTEQSWSSQDNNSSNDKDATRFNENTASTNMLYRTYESNVFRFAFKPGTVLHAVDNYLKDAKVIIAGVTTHGDQVVVSLHHVLKNLGPNHAEVSAIDIGMSSNVILMFERRIYFDEKLNHASRVEMALQDKIVWPTLIRLQEMKAGQILRSIEQVTFADCTLRLKNRKRGSSLTGSLLDRNKVSLNLSSSLDLERWRRDIRSRWHSEIVVPPLD